MPPAFSLTSNHEDSRFIGSSGVLSVTARTSDGLQIPLRWRETDTRNGNDPVVLLLEIPAGYPETVRWADVTLDDHQGDRATWRVTHLPPMQHILPAPVAARAAFHQGAITAHAAAYRGPDPNGNLQGQVLLCDVTGTVKPSPHQWELGPMTLTREWEAPGYVAPSGNVSYGTETKNGVTRIEAADQVIYAQQAQPYLANTHWVRLTARLQEFETYDETAVFHNLSEVKTPTGNRFLVSPRPQTVTTPSGVSVTLVDPRPDRDANNHHAADTDALMIQCVAPNLASLPRSPLWQRFKGVVTLSCEVPKPYEGYGSSGGGAEVAPVVYARDAQRVVVSQVVDRDRPPVALDGDAARHLHFDLPVAPVQADLDVAAAAVAARPGRDAAQEDAVERDGQARVIDIGPRRQQAGQHVPVRLQAARHRHPLAGIDRKRPPPARGQLRDVRVVGEEDGSGVAVDTQHERAPARVYGRHRPAHREHAGRRVGGGGKHGMRSREGCDPQDAHLRHLGDAGGEQAAPDVNPHPAR